MQRGIGFATVRHEACGEPYRLSSPSCPGAMDDSFHSFFADHDVPYPVRFVTMSALAAHSWPMARLACALLFASLTPGAVAAQQSANAPDVRIIAPADTTIVAGEGAFRFRLVVSSPVHVRVTLDRGITVAQHEVYAGDLSDVADISWNVLDAATQQAIEGAVRLDIVAQAADGQTARLQLPLTITATGGDTIPLPGMPADTVDVWKRSPTLPSIATLAAGLLTGAAAVLLPSAVAVDGRGAPIRFAIGGTLGAAGVLGFLAQRENQPDRNAIERNRLTREAWQAAIDRTIEENRQRREVRLRIVTREVMEGAVREPAR